MTVSQFVNKVLFKVDDSTVNKVNGTINDIKATATTIERKDCNGMYEPNNCVWVPLSDQGKNTRRNRYIEYCGKVMTLAEWSRALGGGPNLVTTRLQRGWSEEDAVSTPSKGKKHEATTKSKQKE